MAKTIVGLFDDAGEARQAVEELSTAGFDRNDVTVFDDASDTTALQLLASGGIPEDDARFYVEGVRRGGSLVVIQTEDNLAARASEIINRYNIVDIDTRLEEYRQAGLNDMRVSRLDTEGTVLPVVEEELQIGKREIQRGGVRIHTKITERPVEEQVNLREERVNVERRPVDRPVSDADQVFQAQDFTVTQSAEEAVVQKRARIIEEVVVGKEVQERSETVRGTVRRQDVEVEERGAERAVGASDYDAYDTDFRSHFQTNYANSGYTYDQYAPIYRYGYNLATSDRTRGQDWNAIEANARTTWEERNPNTWEEFKDSVRYAWERARGTR
jgi:uncharacterized protein (TIGR02271 family)